MPIISSITEAMQTLTDRNSAIAEGLAAAKREHPGLDLDELILSVGEPSGSLCATCAEPEFSLIDKRTLQPVLCCRGAINAARMSSHQEVIDGPMMCLSATPDYDGLGLLIGMSRIEYAVEDTDGADPVLGIKSLIAAGRVSTDDATKTVTISTED
jgi:hypothetical protein